MARVGLQSKIDNWPDRFIWHPSFANHYAKRLLKFTVDEAIHTAKTKAAVAGGLASLSALGRKAPLNATAERKMFLKYNYLRYLAHKSRQKPSAAARTMTLINKAAATRNEIADRNGRLVIYMVKRCTREHVPFEDIVSDASWSLLRAIDQFNVGLGWKFSTYATNAISRNLWRMYSEEQRRTANPQLEGADLLIDHRRVYDDAERLTIRDDCDTILGVLSGRERSIIDGRFGLGNSPVQTLAEIGDRMGVTKERIRQVSLRAINKMRDRFRR